MVIITGQSSNEDYNYNGACNISANNKTASKTVKINFDVK